MRSLKRRASKRTRLEAALKQPLAWGKAFASVGCSRGPRCAIVMTIKRIGAQIVEELFDLARQNFRRGSQLAGRREHRSRGLGGLADRVAERTNIADQGLVALSSQLRIRGDLAGRGILLPDGAGDVRRDLVDVTHGVADFAHGIDGVPRRCLDLADVLTYLGSCLGGLFS